eukprot:gene32179-16717_t
MSSQKNLVMMIKSGPLDLGVLSAVLDTEGLTLPHVMVVTQDCAELPSSSKFAVALSSACNSSREGLTKLGRALAAGGKIYVQTNRDGSNAEAVKSDLLLSGFSAGQAVTISNVTLIKSEKPAWDLGSKSALPLKKKTSAAAPKAWTLDGDGDELMDDEELLTEEDRVKPTVAAASDCATSKKACKNCSCGRAEMEAADVAPCALGDAFRCAGCPYRGMPSFELGKKIELGSDLLIADA